MRQLIMGFTVALMTVGTGLSPNLAVAADPQQQTEALLNDVSKAAWIAEGKGPHVVYVFFDANCPYCHKLFLNTRNRVKQGKLQLRWIPTTTLTTTSRGKAAAMLGAKDPLKAFYQNENSYGNGGGVEEDLASADVEKKLTINDDLLARTPSGYVPAMLFRADNGEATLIVGSAPQDKLDKILDHVK